MFCYDAKHSDILRWSSDVQFTFEIKFVDYRLLQKNFVVQKKILISKAERRKHVLKLFSLMRTKLCCMLIFCLITGKHK